MTSEIHFERLGRLGRIVLDRPKALNALTLDQVHAIHPQLAEWAADSMVGAIIIEGAGDKAFCAGGDIRALHDACKAEDHPFVEAFYRDEYRLNRRIKTCPKPYVALIDGIVMGGGVGVSVHGAARVATERTLFAMPETGIGFFPDVGGSYFLPRLPGAIGMYLGLTGARLKAADTFWAGIATHYVPSARLEELRAALAEGGEVAAVLAAFHQDPGPAPLADKQDIIDSCFAADSLEAILARLDAHRDPWAAETLALIRSKSPTALAVAFEQIKRGAALDFDGCMNMEFRLALHVALAPDFAEGIRALLVDRDNKPAWGPPPADLAAWFDNPAACGDLTFD
ncbi:Enoyl-CoA hydratase/carnithine racemase [Magnetospirillum sp. LM-5]|uniref:enoyl-CoA hydratase/isomerase family protein n=1 Tax=Magnetospirillum sp. LM-5 TaxID=2681466 RepID=UPI001383772D|nr:enoyl-CoA hydratase/isomerase family protein [Magnetospirillum sp. LM-5]CAA7625315.1 Enoyl-CoA hydratase/carnithine racemase [Magnetospirillum sp. LM-5]